MIMYCHWQAGNIIILNYHFWPDTSSTYFNFALHDEISTSASSTQAFMKFRNGCTGSNWAHVHGSGCTWHPHIQGTINLCVDIWTNVWSLPSYECFYLIGCWWLGMYIYTQVTWNPDAWWLDIMSKQTQSPFLPSTLYLATIALSLFYER